MLTVNHSSLHHSRGLWQHRMINITGRKSPLTDSLNKDENKIKSMKIDPRGHLGKRKWFIRQCGE